MSNQNTPVLTMPLKLTATVVKNTFVDLTGATATAAAYASGVAMTDGASGAVVPQVVLGTAPVLSSAAIAKGALVEVASGGKAVTKSSGVSVGRAQEAATAADQVIEILLFTN